MFRSLHLLPALLLLAACDTQTSPGDSGDAGSGSDSDSDSGSALNFDLALLTRTGGCGDVTFYKTSDDGTWALVFGGHGFDLTRQSFETGLPVSKTYDLSAEGSLELWQGVELDGLLCNDALTGNEAKYTVWAAVSGTVDVTVESTGDGNGAAWGEYPAAGHISLHNTTLVVEGADVVQIDGLSWDASVGWLPG